MPDKIMRRDILALLGFTAASGVAVASEPLGDTLGAYPRGEGWPKYAPGCVTAGPEYQDRIATMLERLATAIRERRAIASGGDITSSLNHGEFLEHTVSVKVELPLDSGEPIA